MRWRLGVAGYPIGHSLSPALHEEGLRLARLEGSSTRVQLDLDAAGELVELAATRFDALSITMPLKGVVGQYCDALDDVATRTASVNSVLVRGGRILGSSTDGRGFVGALAGELDFDVEGAGVVVVGAGGAARAIVDALVEAKAEHVTVIGRRVATVEAITSRYANVRAANAAPGDADLIVNTVPVEGRDDDVAPASDVRSGAVAVDITYEPRVSSWLAGYERAGCRTQNGLAMLAYQAALQMQWWWDVDIDASRLLEVIS